MMVLSGGRLALRAALRQTRVDPIAFQLRRNGVRNYWWSKPATSEAAHPTQAIPPKETAVPTSIASGPTSEPLSEVVAADSASGVSDIVTGVIAPLQYGDFAALGLTSWWPSGIIRWSFEVLQVSTGMPWFYTIIAGTLFWRAVLVPSALTAIRNTARLAPYTEQIKTLDEQTQGVKDRAAQMEIMLKKQKLIEKAGVSLRSMFLPPVIQMVGNFGLFFAIKGMVQLPVMQLTQSGVWFLPDLTLTGDYMMPALVLLGMNIQFSVMKRDLDPSKPAMAHFMNVMRVASFATLPMMSWMPSGLWLSMLAGMTLSTAQSVLLRVPRIRQALAIPPATLMPPVTMRDTGRMILEWCRQTRTEVEANHARKPNWTSLPKASRRVR